MNPATLPYETPTQWEWPKICRCCDTIYTRQGWGRLHRVGFMGHFRHRGSVYALELRDCVCGSTLAIEVEIPLALPTIAGAAPAPVCPPPAL